MKKSNQLMVSVCPVSVPVKIVHARWCDETKEVVTDVYEVLALRSSTWVEGDGEVVTIEEALIVSSYGEVDTPDCLGELPSYMAVASPTQNSLAEAKAMMVSEVKERRNTRQPC